MKLYPPYVLLVTLMTLLCWREPLQAQEGTLNSDSAIENMIKFLPALVDLGMVGENNDVTKWQKLLQDIQDGLKGGQPTTETLESLQEFLELVGASRERLRKGLNSEGQAIGLTKGQLKFLENLGEVWSGQEEEVLRIVERCLNASRRGESFGLTAEDRKMLSEYDEASVLYVEEVLLAYNALVKETDENIARLEAEREMLQNQIEEEQDETKRKELQDKLKEKEAELEEEKEKRRRQEEFKNGFNLGKFLLGLGLTVVGIITLDSGENTEIGGGLLSVGVKMMGDAISGSETREREYDEKTGRVKRKGVVDKAPSAKGLEDAQKRLPDSYKFVGKSDSNFALAVSANPVEWKILQVDPFMVLGTIAQSDVVIPVTDLGITSIGQLTEIADPILENPKERFTLTVTAKFKNKQVIFIIEQKSMINSTYDASVEEKE